MSASPLIALRVGSRLFDMGKLWTGLTLFLFPCFAQLPNLFLVGGEYSSSASPKFSGFAAFAKPVNQSLGMYSFTLHQALIHNKNLVTSDTTGLADDFPKTRACSKRGCLALVGLGTAGVSSGAAITPAYAAGGGFVFRSTGGWALGAFALENMTSGWKKPNALLGIGRIF
jgi:hypothetical protein